MQVKSIAFCLALALASSANAQGDHPGLAIGKPAPDFTLKDQNNEPVHLAELIKKGKVAIVFHRSADW